MIAIHERMTIIHLHLTAEEADEVVTAIRRAVQDGDASTPSGGVVVHVHLAPLSEQPS